MAMQSNLTAHILLGFLAIVFAVIFSNSGLFGVILFGMVIACIIGLCSLVFLIQLFFQKDFFKWFGVTSIYAILSMVLCIIFIVYKGHSIREDAKRTVEKIEEFKKSTGSYPNSLKRLENIEYPEKYSYRPEMNNRYYELSYSVDGFHTSLYDSQIKKWKTTD